MTMDPKDAAIADLIQTKFPVNVRPYRVIGEAVGLSEDEVIERIAVMKKNDIIRRVGALINPKRVGYVSSLIAAKVDTDKIDQVVPKINSYVGVTHNYHRDDEFNVWFTLIAKGPEAHQRIFKQIKSIDGIIALHSLPATKIFKLKVNFKAGEDQSNGEN